MADQLSAAVRRLVASRAGHQCEYCLLPEDCAGFPHQVDHILSRKHGGSSEADNLAYCCMICNRNKGSDVASLHNSGTLVRLFDPRRDKWEDHFLLDDAVIHPLTQIGNVTASVLRLNLAERVIERGLLRSLGRYPRRRR